MISLESITKTKVTKEDILKMTRKAFGKSAKIQDIRELTQGFFNTAYMVTLEREGKLVLKISPKKK